MRSIAQPTSASVAATLSNAVPGMGMYDQLSQQQQYQQFQKQSFFHLSSPFRDFDVRPMYAAQAADRYGMRGLLNVLKFPNPATTSLALGTDLTTLGLNLNSPEPVHKMFASPWSEEPAKEEPEFLVPDCYKAKLPPPLKVSTLTSLVILLMEFLYIVFLMSFFLAAAILFFKIPCRDIVLCLLQVLQTSYIFILANGFISNVVLISLSFLQHASG